MEDSVAARAIHSQNLPISIVLRICTDRFLNENGREGGRETSSVAFLMQVAEVHFFT